VKKPKDGNQADDAVQVDENPQTGKKKKLVIQIRDLTRDEAANVSGGLPPTLTGGGTTMCCW
jgi:hypothetical protein